MIRSTAEDPVEFLRRRGAGSTPHSPGRCLLDHLTGTADLVAAWGCARHVVAAALFGIPKNQWLRIRAEDVLDSPVEHLIALAKSLALQVNPEWFVQMLRAEEWEFAAPLLAHGAAIENSLQTHR